MVVRLVILVSVYCLLANPAHSQRLTPPLPEIDVKGDAALLISVVRDIHPGYLRYRSESDAATAEQELREAASEAQNAGTFYLAVSKFLATIRCEHTEAELPQALLDWRNTMPTMIPVDFEWVEDRAIVTGMVQRQGQGSGDGNVTIGDELVAINGQSVQDIFESISPHISVDGFTDHTRANIFAGVDDIGLTTLDVFYPLLFGFQETLDLTVRQADGVERTITVPLVDEQASLEARGATNAQRNFSDEGAVSWQRVGNAAVLSISTFVNYRTPVNPDEVFGPVFEEIKASGAERLVLDLRPVGGGSDDVMASLLRHLLNKPAEVGGPAKVRTYDLQKYRGHLSSWDESVFNMPPPLFTSDGEGMFVVNETVSGGVKTVEPAPQAWTGDLSALIGPDNESGATMLLAELVDDRAVTLIGQPTGGSAEGPTAGILVFLRLPESDITVRVPLVRARTSFDSFVEGMGIAPDLEVSPTVADVRARKDSALDVAVGMVALVPEELLGRWAGAAIEQGTPRLFELEFSVDGEGQLFTMLTLPYNAYDQFPYAFDYAPGGAYDGYLTSALFGDKMSLVVDFAEGHLRGTVTVGDSIAARVHLQRVPDYDLPGYEVEELRFAAGPDTLAGSLLLPSDSEQPPTALLVAGRGYDTRSSLVIYAKLLARNGIAAFVFDGRGTGRSTGDGGAATGTDRFDDVNSALDLLLERPDLGPVGVIGNSAAGWIVPDVAADRDDVAFVITLVGPAVSLAEQQAQVTRAFMRASGDTFSDAEYAEAFAYQRQTVELAQSGAPWSEFERINADARAARWVKHALIPESTDDDDLDYFRRRLEFDAPSWDRVRVPSLAIFGENDQIVPPQDNVPVLEEALQQNEDATILVLGGANHSLARPEATVGSGSWPERYYRPWTRNSVFYETLVSWIAERFVR